MSDERDTQGRFVAGNRVSTVHSGAAAQKAVQHGVEFTGLPAQVERDITAEADATGAASIIRKAAARLETVARLYYDAFQAACEQRDIDKMTLYIKTWGWVQNSSVRAWLAVAQDERKAGGISPADVLDAITKDKSNEQNE